MKGSICVSTVSVVCALGTEPDEILSSVTTGGESALTPSSWGPEARACFTGVVPEKLLQEPCGIPEFESRATRILHRALSSINVQLAELKERYDPGRIGVVLGSSTSGIGEAERMYRELVRTGRRPLEYSYSQQELGTVSEYLVRVLGISGPSYTVSTACSSSAKVFRSGRALISAGLCDAVIVGGCDCLCDMTLWGFGSLDLLSPSPCNPFSANRQGISIGEGAALFVLERGEEGVQLLGIGESSDAYHMSSPDPDGRGAVAAMNAAFLDAGVRPQEIDYVNLHGTGTLHNDAMESKAMTRIFGEGVPCSSTKGFIGHLLGASGGVELAICLLVLKAGSTLSLPRHHFDGEIDAQLPSLDLVTKPRTLSRSATAAVMSNSFGFGGSNCSVILGRGW